MIASALCWIPWWVAIAFGLFRLARLAGSTAQVELALLIGGFLLYILWRRRSRSRWTTA